MSSASSITVLRTASELEALIPEWEMLWDLDARAKPFQRPEWLLPWWHQFGQPAMHVLAFRKAGTLTGVLPLYVYEDPDRAERQLLLLGAGTSDYLDGVFSPACTDEAIASGLALVAEEDSWDVAHLAQIPPGSRLGAVMGMQNAAGVRRYPGEACSRCPALLIAELPKKVRADVRYFRNFATSRGELRLRVADAATLQRDFVCLVEQHTSRWNEAGLPGVLADPRVLAWHQEALPLLLAKGALRLYTLSLDAIPIATLYALIDPATREERTEYFYLIGHSQAHAELKPGMLLTAMATEYAAGEGVRVIDMLRGDEVYKKFWHVEEVATAGYSMERSAMRQMTG